MANTESTYDANWQLLEENRSQRGSFGIIGSETSLLLSLFHICEVD